MMNSKGQAYSTFKLLIAAIVAMAILTILFSIIGVIPSLGQTDPTDAITTSLKDASAGKLSSEVVSNPVQFARGTNINSRAVVSGGKVALTQEQVCLLLGDFSDGDCDEGKPNWEYTSLGQSITYDGGDKQAKIAVLCDKGIEGVKSAISLGGRIYDALGEDDYEDHIDDCCPIDEGICEGDSETCCVVVLLGN